MSSPNKHKLHVFTDEPQDRSDTPEIQSAIELSFDGIYKKSPGSGLTGSKRTGLLQKPYANNAPPKKFLCLKRREKNWKYMPDREIYPLIEDKSLPDNSIHTSKYTWWTFLPINLLEQFSQLANVYFLMILYLQTVPEISITGRKPVMVIPLSIIVLVSGVKSLFEDYKRHVSDREENNRVVEVFRHTDFVPTTWKSLRVGDVVKVTKNQQFPADLIMLYTKDPKGRAYVETKSLDGETNLKMKFVNKEIIKQFADNYEISESHYSSFMYEKPNPYLYQFKGTGTIVDSKISLDYSNFLLRGSSLKNTEFVLGLVVYTGHETKIMLNSTNAKPKIPKVSKILSRFVLMSFCCQVFFCAMTTLLGKVYTINNQNTIPYLQFETGEVTIWGGFFYKVGTWVLNFINFIPISMLTTIELIRFFQAAVITRDKSMVTDDIAPVVQASSHNEELGQVQYVFTDKTGTLTANQMVFKKLSVNGHSYGESFNESNLEMRSQSITVTTNVNFTDVGFFNVLDSESNREHANVSKMLMAQAVCHTVMVEYEGNKPIFTASSPDELALINFAKMCRYQYLGTDEHNILKVVNEENEHNFQVLNVLEFNSDRKRMSVIVKDESGQIILYCKGADSIMLERVSKDTNHKIIDATKHHLREFGNEGLRTLVYASKHISTEDYNEWARKYANAITSMIDREQKVEALQAEIETNMELLGATGIEDKLQDEVSETIAFFIDADIKVWMLTGDKVETARSIGRSCGLIRPYMHEFVIEALTDEDLETELGQALNETLTSDLSLNYYVLITGDALLHLTHSPSAQKLKQRFASLALEAKTVLACRVSPKQKQEVVEIVRSTRNTAITLSIGDGANDVNMITAAHVGIGIKGKEGLQAARASDFSIGEFKHLKKLTFYYGREFYRNNTTAILYNFFKNVVLVLPQFWCGFLNMFSGQTPYDVFLYQFFNTFYAALPIIIYAINDREYSEETFANNPKLYALGKENQIFKITTFMKWMANGALQAAIVGFLPFMMMENTALDDSGTLSHFKLTGIMIFTIVTINSNIKVWIMAYSRSWLFLLSMLGSVIAYFFSLALISLRATSDLHGAFVAQHTSLLYYSTIIIVVIASSGIDFVIQRYDILMAHETNTETLRESISMKASQKTRFSTESEFLTRSSADRFSMQSDGKHIL